MILNLTPDWTERWSKEEAEKELFQFQFKGTGWYISKNGEALLVSDLSSVPTKDGSEPVKRYRFDYWSVSPLETFNWIVNAPVRHDDR